MSYKDSFYTKYFSTHILPRKGEITLKEFDQWFSYFHDRWSRYFPKDKGINIVDVGCGNGALLWWLQRSGYMNSQGIDISAEQVELCRTFGVENVHQYDMREFLAKQEDCFDIIILKDVIEHFMKSEIIEILVSCYSSLRNNGRVIIQVPNAEAPFFGRIRYGDFTHEVAFSSTSLSQVLYVVGFSKIQCYSTEPSFNNLKSLTRFVLWKFVEAFYRFLLYTETGSGRRIVTQGIIAVATKTE
jgi:2-polyprenyl-3-methyl-5-hydroxy-6-metoxy-1,4-benzoquinol methylase